MKKKKCVKSCTSAVFHFVMNVTHAHAQYKTTL